MPPLSVMFKTVSTDCNLDCSYCYYRESLEGIRVRRRIDNGMLEKFIPDYMAYVADVGLASMAWQGGEPTLAGLSFFEKIVALQRRHARPGTVIQNALQTNAILLNDAWGAFLKSHDFLVGVSLDGPEAIHDLLRHDRGGHGSFRKVMGGINVLRRHQVTFNALCVLGPHNVGKPRDLIRFFRSEGFTHVQFIPAMDFQAADPYKPPAYLISPQEYGHFLTEAFDLWYEGGAPTTSIRIFDNFLQSHLGIPNDQCVHSDSCNAGIVIEYDGSAYPCDFYVHPDWKLGNVTEAPLRDIALSASRRRFISHKQPLPVECARCEWLSICKSGCPRNRTTGPNGDSPDYFCASYKQFFAHGEKRLEHIATSVRNRQRYDSELARSARRPTLIGRNEPCPCGSGAKHKQCCGDPLRLASYVLAR